MILVDTSIWVDHLPVGDRKLATLLADGRVLTHPSVIGELALGGFRQREVVLIDLSELPGAVVARDAEVLRFIDRHALFGRGVGYVPCLSAGRGAIDRRREAMDLRQKTA